MSELVLEIKRPIISKKLLFNRLASWLKAYTIAGLFIVKKQSELKPPLIYKYSKDTAFKSKQSSNE